MNQSKLLSIAFVFIAVLGCFFSTAPVSHAGEAEKFLCHYEVSTKKIEKSNGRISSTASVSYGAKLVVVENENDISVRFNEISHVENIAQGGDDVDPLPSDIVDAVRQIDGSEKYAITITIDKRTGEVKLNVGGQSVSSNTLSGLESALVDIGTRQSQCASAVAIVLLKEIVIFDDHAGQEIEIGDEALALESIRPPLESGSMSSMYRPTSFIVTGIDKTGDRLLLSQGVLSTKSGLHVFWESRIRKKVGHIFPVSLNDVHTALMLLPHADGRTDLITKNRTQVTLKRKD